MENYQIEQRVRIDFAYAGVPPRVYAKQYDNNMRVVSVDLYENGVPYTIPTGYAANVRLDKRDGHYVYNPAIFGSGNTVFVILTQQMLANPGELPAEIEIVQGGNVLKSADFVVACEPSAVPDKAIKSSDEYKTVQEIAESVEDAAKIIQDNKEAIDAIPGQIADIEGLVDQAEAARDTAEEYKTAACQCAGAAADRVAEAAAKAGEAAASAAQAADSESKALQYAQQAGSVAVGNKGYFPTPQALMTAYPTGDAGWWAIVGETEEGTVETVWAWDLDANAWVNTDKPMSMVDYPEWSQLSNKLLVPCTCTYNDTTHTFSLTRKDVSQQLADGAELTFRPLVGYTRGDKVEFEGAEIPLEYAGSPVDVQTGAWLAGRPAKLIWYNDEEGGSPNALRSRRRALA